MITKLTLRNFKSIGEQTYELKRFDLFVGPNNCGKSTILQALAIWQFCVDEFRRAKRSGVSGVQVVLPNFTALPVPEFDLLWKDRTDRRYTIENRNRKQEYILIEIGVEWPTDAGEKKSFEVKLRYNSPQSVYAIPSQGWDEFRKLDEEKSLPVIAYVPPFSGLAPHEEWRDDVPIRAQVGMAQPGGVLRNLLLKVCWPKRDDKGRISKDYVLPEDWVEVKEVVKRWFSVELQEPQYERGVDKDIVCLYRESGSGTKHKKKGKKDLFDIIAGGSGFHQTLTLLAFLYGYRPTTILLDEPDAHLHVKLQREILEYFKQRSNDRGTQFLIATHAEELITGVDVSQIISLLEHRQPRRVESTAEILRAMADLSNTEIAALLASPFLLYIEGDNDERVLRAWAKECRAESIFSKLCFHVMGGGPKEKMKENADKHFAAVKQVVPNVTRLMLFDYDTQERAFHPEPENPCIHEWRRKNIENYLLVPDAWRRAALRESNLRANDLFAQPIAQLIGEFFSRQNLTLPPGETWRNVKANVFEVVDGKRILFENQDSLFQQLRRHSPRVELIREAVAGSMTAEEIHEDVHAFFAKLNKAIIS